MVRNVLVVDTATRRATVALVGSDGVVHGVYHDQAAMHAERLLGMLDDVVVEARLAVAPVSLAAVDLIAVGKGPGSFTGVRVGMAAAKGLAFALGIPVVGVLSLASIAHTAREVVGDCPVVSLIDAKKGEVFAACFGRDGQLLVGPTHIARNDVAAWIASAPSMGDDTIVVGEVAGELALEGCKWVRSAECDLPGARAMAALAVATWSANNEDQIDGLEPLYVRPPDITQPAAHAVVRWERPET